MDMVNERVRLQFLHLVCSRWQMVDGVIQLDTSEGEPSHRYNGASRAGLDGKDVTWAG